MASPGLSFPLYFLTVLGLRKISNSLWRWLVAPRVRFRTFIEISSRRCPIKVGLFFLAKAHGLRGYYFDLIEILTRHRSIEVEPFFLAKAFGLKGCYFELVEMLTHRGSNEAEG